MTPQAAMPVFAEEEISDENLDTQQIDTEQNGEKDGEDIDSSKDVDGDLPDENKDPQDDTQKGDTQEGDTKEGEKPKTIVDETELTALIEGANEAAGRLNEAVSNLNAEDEASIEAVYAAMDDAQTAMEKLQDALGDDENSDAAAAIDAVVAAINAAGAAWEAASEETPTTLDDPDAQIDVESCAVSIQDYHNVLNYVDITAKSDTAEGGAFASDVEIDNDGQMMIESGKFLKLTVTAKSGVNCGIKVLNGKTELTLTDGACVLEIKEAIYLTVEITEQYAFGLNVSAAGGCTLSKLVKGEDGTEAPAAIANGDDLPKDGALRFVVNGYSYPENEKLGVTYAVNGGEEVDISTYTEEADQKIYTVPADVINSRSLETLKITLVKNETKTVTFDGDKDKLKISYWGVKEDSTEDWIEIPAAEGTGAKTASVIAGDSLTFKVEKDGVYRPKTVDLGDGNGAKDVNETGEYTVKVTDDTTITITAAYDAEKSKELSFVIDGDKDSATATVKLITMSDDSELTDSSSTTIDAYLGTTDGALGTDKVLVPEAVKSIKVEFAFDKDVYTLTNVGNHVVTDAEKTAGKVELTYNYAEIGEIKAVTEAVESQAATYFKIAKPAASTGLTLNVPVGTGDDAVIKKHATADTYEVKTGTDAVEFTVTAKEGYSWSNIDTAATGLKAMAGDALAGGEVKETKNSDGTTVYTVKLLAAKLGADAASGVKNLGTPEGKVKAFGVTYEPALTKATAGDIPDSEGLELTSLSGVGGYKVDAKFPVSGMANTTVAITNLPYGAKFGTRITADAGYRLTKVSYKFGENGAENEVTEFLQDDSTNQYFADVVIDRMTDDVIIKVETAAARTLSLSAVTGTAAPTQPNLDEGDKTYYVTATGKYTVVATPGWADATELKNFSAEIKDGGEVVGKGQRIGTDLQIWMTKDFQGKELSVEVKEKEAVIGELILQVAKTRTSLSINGGSDINQDVASKAVYPIETDGEKLADGTAAITIAAETDDGSLFTDYLTAAKTAGKIKINADGNLEIDLPDTTFSNVIKRTYKTVDGKQVIDEENPDVVRTAKITVTPASGDPFKASVLITANPVLDPDEAPSVSVSAGKCSDTAINAYVSMDSVKEPKSAGKVYYVVTATGKADVAAKDGQPAETLDTSKLERTKTVIVPKTGSGQYVTLDLAKAGVNLGDGAQWDYDVTAVAAYATDGSEPTGTTAAVTVTGDKSRISEKAAASTVAPLFENSLKLKKGKGATTTFYTGQTDVNLYVATPEFSKKLGAYEWTTNVVDTTQRDGGIQAEVNNAGNLVVTSVPVGTTVGKHVLEVTAAADRTEKADEKHWMYASRATISVTVNRGINTIDILPNTGSVYKPAGKAAGMSVKLDLNGSNTNKANKPKSSKVSYEVVGVGSRMIIDGSYKTLTKVPAPAGISISKSGKVTVDKNFSIDTRHPNNNKFRIVVKAEDYTGNDHAAISNTFTVTSEAQNISTLIIAKRNALRNGYDVIAAGSGKQAVKVDATKVEGAILYAAASPVNAGYVSQAKWNTLGVIDPGSVDYKPTNNKDKKINVNSDGIIKVKKAGSKVTLTATATDGSKKKASISLDLGYTKVSPLAAMKVTAMDETYKGGDTANGKSAVVNNPQNKETEAKDVTKSYDIAGAAYLEVQIKGAELNDEGKFKGFADLDPYANYQLKVKGGKVESGNGSHYYILANAKTTVLTLTMGKGKESKKYVYTLTNTGYVDTVAPKVTVQPLHQKGLVAEQQLKITALNGKETFGANKTVKVEMDYSKVPKENTPAYWAWSDFVYSYGDAKIATYNKDTGEVEFKEADLATTDGGYIDGEESIGLTPGTYHMLLTVGTGATLKNFKAETKTVSVPVKVVKNAAFSYKPQSTYTFNVVDGAVVLTGKSNAKEGAKVDYRQLQNNNVNGKSNKFTHYFKIKEVGGTQYLVLNEADDAVKMLMYNYTVDANGKITYSGTKHTPDLTKIPKENLVGYVRYTAEPAKGYYSHNNYNVSQYAKITIKIAKAPVSGKAVKASQKYTSTLSQIGSAAANKTTEVNLLVDGKYIKTAAVAVDDSKKNDGSLVLNGKGVNASGQITLKGVGTLEAEKKYSINLLVIPELSYYKGQDPKTYGIPVTVTVIGKAKELKTEPGAAFVEIPAKEELPPPVTGAQAKTALETYLTGLASDTAAYNWYNAYLKDETLQTKANANPTVSATGWTVEITAVTVAGGTVSTAGTVSVDYTLNKVGETSVPGTRADLVMPEGAVQKAAAKAFITGTVVPAQDSSATPTSLVSALKNVVEAKPGYANLAKYWTIEYEGPASVNPGQPNDVTVNLTANDTNGVPETEAETISITVNN